GRPLGELRVDLTEDEDRARFVERLGDAHEQRVVLLAALRLIRLVVVLFFVHAHVRKSLRNEGRFGLEYPCQIKRRGPEGKPAQDYGGRRQPRVNAQALPAPSAAG